MSPADLKRGLAAVVFAGFILMGLAGCHSKDDWNNTDMTGSLPRLAFTMARARDGRTVTAEDYRGKVVLLYFGYSSCTDACPRTLSSLADVLKEMKGRAHDVRVLFVTVDPERDTLAVLKRYEALFGPEFDALRGTPDQLAALARRYRVSYSVTPAKDGKPYIVTHSAGVYVFGRDGSIRLLLSKLEGDRPDIAGTAADLTRLADWK
ncbi:MAG: SCO family protein [Alphaproteobacteria bacterium]|nr:SCO family protein [Alphaproteobacteria bacterium]